MDAQKIKCLMDDEGGYSARSARIEGLAFKIIDGIHAGVGRYADLNRALLVIPHDAEILERIALERGARAGIALIVRVGHRIRDFHFAVT